MTTYDVMLSKTADPLIYSVHVTKLVDDISEFSVAVIWNINTKAAGLKKQLDLALAPEPEDPNLATWEQKIKDYLEANYP